MNWIRCEFLRTVGLLLCVLCTGCASSCVTFNPAVVEGFSFKCSAERYAEKARSAGYRAVVRKETNPYLAGANYWVRLEN